jgi:hypothetical protein
MGLLSSPLGFHAKTVARTPDAPIFGTDVSLSRSGVTDLSAFINRFFDAVGYDDTSRFVGDIDAVRTGPIDTLTKQFGAVTNADYDLFG